MTSYIYSEAIRSIRKGNLNVLRSLNLFNSNLYRPGESVHEFVAIAAEHGRLDMLKYLRSLGADIRYDKDLALRMAAKEGHLDVVE